MLENPALVCFDLPCLVVPRAGTADEALDRALRRMGFDPDGPPRRRASELGIGWPGTAARAALTEVFGGGAVTRAAAAAFDDAFGAVVSRHGAVVADGASAAIAQLRARGALICVTTEFSAATREAVLDVLEWSSLVAMLVSEDAEDSQSPGSAVADAILRARLEPRQVVVVSDSATGVAAGRTAGVGCVVGVYGRGASARELRGAGATCISTLPQLASRWAVPALVPA